MCIYYKYTIYSHFSGPNSVSFSFSFSSPLLPLLPYDEFVWRAFSSWAKAWMHIPSWFFFFFFCEMGNIPWGKLRSENQSSYDPLRVCFFTLLSHELSFAAHICCLPVCLVEFGDGLLCSAAVKSCWLFSLFVDLSMGKETKSKWLDRLL